MKLPFLFTRANKIPMGLLMIGITLGPYLYLNRLGAERGVPLPLTWIDRAVPFVPETVWVYLTYFLIFPSAFFWEKDERCLNRYMAAVIGINVVSDLCFLFWPTVYDRSPVGPPTGVFTYLYAIDTPANCLPSLHVSASYLAALLWFRRFPRRFYVYLAWATAIAVSTLTTKQHYLVDIVAALGLAVFFHWLAFCRLDVSGRNSP